MNLVHKEREIFISTKATRLKMTTSSHNYISGRCINTAEGIKILNDFDYLNHLLENTDEIVKSHNQQAIKSLRWDFQELKGSSTLSSFYQLTIDSHINFLTRILKYVPFRTYKPNVYMNISSDEE